MSYQQGNMKIDEEGDGKAKVTVRNPLNGRWAEASIFRNNRQKAAQAVAGDEYVVVSAAEVDRMQRQESRAEDAIARLLAVEGAAAEEGKNLDAAYVRNSSSESTSDERPARPRVAGTCPSCKQPRLVLNTRGHVVCENDQCAIPRAAGETLVDPDLGCRCGRLRTEPSQTIGKPPHPTCTWHEARDERKHRGWVIMTADEAAALRSDQDVISEMISTIQELTEQLRLSVEYVGIDVLRPWPGWGWYDALKKHMPDFDEWLAKIPSKPTAYLATEAGKHDSIDNVLTTLHFAKEAIKDNENEDFDDPEENQAYIEQLDRLINACERVRRNAENDDLVPAADDDALLGVVSPAEEKPKGDSDDDATYPRAGLGGTILLGPEIFARFDGSVINWKGENYYPRPDPASAGSQHIDETAGDGDAWVTADEREKRYVEAFQKAWHAADERGLAGARTLHGVRAVLDVIRSKGVGHVKGRCPECGQNQLVVSESGHILCSYRHCTNIGESVAVEDLNPADRVKGRCPACGQHELGLDQSGRVLCSYRHCTNPGATDRLLERGHTGESVVVEDLNIGDRVRAKFIGENDEWYIVEGEISARESYVNDRTLYFDGPGRRVRTHLGHPDPLLDEVFILERASVSEVEDEVREVAAEISAHEFDQDSNPWRCTCGDWESKSGTGSFSEHVARVVLGGIERRKDDDGDD